MSGKPRTDEAIRVVQIAELSEDLHAHGFLRLDELTVEELDQGVARTRLERVASELDDSKVLV
jgi:hypothetical protein